MVRLFVVGHRLKRYLVEQSKDVVEPAICDEGLARRSAGSGGVAVRWGCRSPLHRFCSHSYTAGGSRITVRSTWPEKKYSRCLGQLVIFYRDEQRLVTDLESLVNSTPWLT